MSRSCKCGEPARVKRNKTGDIMCVQCFIEAFEDEVHHTIATSKMFKRGEKVAIGASGGKDSTALAKVMSILNSRHDYGLDLVLVSVDEGIVGYRDDSLETVKDNEKTYNIPLKIVSYKDLYGWTMDDIVRSIGKKSNCTFCGVFRRQALDRGAALVGADRIVTGHNADDIAETVVMNMMRGDVARLSRCTAVTTGSEGMLPRSKPFKYTYEKDICLYVEFMNLLYFSTECKYAPDAYRGYARTYIKRIEAIRPSAIIDIIHSGEQFRMRQETRMPVQGKCERCGYVASKKICQACELLEGLNKGVPLLGIGKANKVRRMAREKGVTLDSLEPAPKCGTCGGEASQCQCRQQRRKRRDFVNVGDCSGGGCGQGGCGGQGLQTRFGELNIDF